MNFTKMQGLGNDYVYIYTEKEIENPNQLSVKLSDRHFGIGSDGLIVISPSSVADFKMRIFNADGSEAKMCGNGIRCVGKYVFDNHLTDKTELSVETLSGIKYLHLFTKGGTVKLVSVDMGKAVVGCRQSVKIEGQTVEYYPVDMGNPHAVVFCKDAETVPVEKIGSLFQKLDVFKDGVNVEFVSKISENRLRLRVFERGSGVTLACGTGACAGVSAAIKHKLCLSNTETEVKLDGGSLYITVDGEFSVSMKGPAEAVFDGRITL